VQAKQCRELFLHLDDGLGLLQPGLQCSVLTLQTGQLGGLRCHFAATFLGRQPLERTTGALLAPFFQVRSIQSFPAYQGADRAAFAAGVGFGQNAQLIFGAEPPPFCLSLHYCAP